MNTTHTLKELADIGAKAQREYLRQQREAEAPDASFNSEVNFQTFASDQNPQEVFTQAILDAIGYKLPKDEEREAFERWCQSQQPLLNDTLAKEYQFAAWKAGREELRKEVCSDKCEDSKTEPAWIPWNGGECPLPDTVKRWEVRFRDGFEFIRSEEPRCYAWSHGEMLSDIIAYRVWE